MKKKLTLFLLTCICFQLNAQEAYTILFKTGAEIPTENIRDVIDTHEVDAEEIFEGYFYRLVQFYDIPSSLQHEQIASEGIQLLQYLPHRAYIAAIPTHLDLQKLEALNVRSVLPLDLDRKIADNLKGQTLGSWAVTGNRVEVMIQYHKNIKQQDLLAHLASNDIKIVLANGINNYIKASIPKNKIQAIAALPFVAHMSIAAEPGIPDDTEGRSLHRANLLDTSFPNGRSYTGKGINILVRDDGTIGPHIDYQGRLNQDFNTNDENQVSSNTHGDNVAGILAGAGNYDPHKRGMAADAFIHTTQYEATHLDATMSLHFNSNVLVTNSSYSNGCNDGYTEITATVDQQVYENPTLIHVFSAGNSNGSTCGDNNYGAGGQWANITGGHKQGKNVMTTANIFNDGTLVGSSSRGPAYDGRIKPDISANGVQFSTEPMNTYDLFGGTSGAAPGVAGVFTQLHQAYADLNAGETGESALIKACMLNTANDLGNVGPDYQYGWGHINAYRAVLTLEENRYFKSSVEPGAVQTHELMIPSGVEQVKVMVYWSDPEAEIGTSKALINNLDARIVANGMTYEPWILDPTPNPSNLDAPATKGVDDLNNMEQIVIDSAMAGMVTLEVNGTELPFGVHEYYVVYEFVTNEITLTYPLGGEGFTPGNNERIHWDAFGDDDTFFILSSLDGGATWQQIAQVPGTARMYEWPVPNEFTGQAKIRVSRQGLDSESENFSISRVPTGLVVTQACPNYITLEWNEVANATGYKIFRLGQESMDEVGISTATNTFQYDLPFQAQLEEEHYFAIAALGDNDLESERSIAVFYEGGLLECVLTNDVALPNIQNIVDETISSCDALVDENLIVTITNLGSTPQDDITVAYQVNNDPVVTEALGQNLAPGETINFTYSTPISLLNEGAYFIKTWVSTPNEEYFPNDTTTAEFELVFDVESEDLDIVEDFNNINFPPDMWSTISTDFGGIKWGAKAVSEANGGFGFAMFMNNYLYEDALVEPQIDYVYTMPIEVPADLENVGLTFDIAYAQRFANGQILGDEFRIELSTNCGWSFPHVLYDKAGEDLQTVSAPLPNSFSPSLPVLDDWRNESIDLSPYIGSTITIRFVSISHNGNNLYLDNINILNQVSTSVFDEGVTFDMSVSPNPSKDVFELKIESSETENLRWDLFNVQGVRVQEGAFDVNIGTTQEMINAADFPAGIYYLKVHNTDTFETMKLIKM